MKNNTSFWTAFWSVIKFILTLGISHITQRENRIANEKSDSSKS